MISILTFIFGGEVLNAILLVVLLYCYASRILVAMAKNTSNGPNKVPRVREIYETRYTSIVYTQVLKCMTIVRIS